MVVHARGDAGVGVDVDEVDDDGLSGLSWMPSKSGRSHSHSSLSSWSGTDPRGDAHT